MDKMLVSSDGDVTITNDGTTHTHSQYSPLPPHTDIILHPFPYAFFSIVKTFAKYEFLANSIFAYIEKNEILVKTKGGDEAGSVVHVTERSRSWLGGY